MIESSIREFVDSELRSRADARGFVVREALERLARRPPVSVVIPAYNGGRLLGRCVDSVLTTTSDAEVVVVDDRSSEPAVRDVCGSLLARRPTAKVVLNEQNRGFVASVNAGIHAATPSHDLVLLNSDTVVTERWLEKLSRAAYTRAGVATVTPLSNAAGVFSLPVAYEDRDIPPGWTPDGCARLLESVSRREHPIVPVGSGYCLYVRREALDTAGLFDELLIRRGYGEENDFCERASAAGLTHVVDDATFIFHERAASFEGGKAALKANNSRVLKAIHPGHTDRMAAWLREGRLDGLRERYGRMLAAAEDPGASPPGRVADGAIRLMLRDGAARRQDDVGSRDIDVAISGRHVQVNLFGHAQRRVTLRSHDRLSFVAWLALRWSASELSLLGDPIDPDDASLLRSALSTRATTAASA